MGMRTDVARCGGWQMICGEQNFSIQKVYLMLTEARNKVGWHIVISKNIALPKSKFFVWLIALQRLPTLDRFLKWNMNVDLICRLCGVLNEDHNHMFMLCTWTNELRQLLFTKMLDTKASSLAEDCIRVSKVARKKSVGAKAYVLMWSEFIYEVWLMRCRVLYQQVCLNIEIAKRSIMFRVGSSCIDGMENYM